MTILDNIFPLLGRAIRGIPIEKVFFSPRDPQEELKKFIEAEQVEASEKPVELLPPASTAVPPETWEGQKVATACVPCALGHFSTSSGLLNECVRFKEEGITSNEVLDRVAKVLAEQNALERVDLTPEKIQRSPDWERPLAERALEKSRGLRHMLEGMTSMADIEAAAADAATFYRELNREYFKRSFAHHGHGAARPAAPLSLEEAKQLAADGAAREVERRWKSPEKT